MKHERDPFFKWRFLMGKEERVKQYFCKKSNLAVSVVLIFSLIFSCGMPAFAQAQTGQTESVPMAPGSSAAPSQQSEAQMRSELESDERQIDNLLNKIAESEKFYETLFISLKETTEEATEVTLEATEKQIEQLKNQLERRISNFENKLAKFRAVAQKASSAFVQFLKNQTENMAQKRAEQLAKIQQRIEERKAKRAQRKAKRQEKKEQRIETRQERRDERQAEKEAQERKEAQALAANKKKVLSDIEGLKAAVAKLEKENKSYSRDKKKQVVNDLKDRINAVEKFARDTKANKDGQVKEALKELNKLFNKAK